MFVFGAALAGCAPIPSRAPFDVTPVGYDALAGWADDDHAAAADALARSCEAGAGRGLGASAAVARRPAEAWAAVCDALRDLPPGDAAAARAFFETWFVPHLVTASGGGEALVTGYYEPLLYGSLTPSERFSVPLYVRPPELVTVDLGAFRRALKGERIVGEVVDGRLVPFPARRAIDEGALVGRGLELVWVDDSIDAFFLHIQGSGRILLDDGTELRVGYAASNGRPYTAIGGPLIANGEIAHEDMSMQAIRAWLADNPDRAETLMQKNASYVFFRQLDDDGPIGAQGVVLSPARSIAVDPRFHAYGTPVWVDVEDVPYQVRTLAIAQDTGGAITGPLRGDFFWGHGAYAEYRAGGMAARGKLYVLLPRPPPSS